MKDAQNIKNPFKGAKAISEELFNSWHKGDEMARNEAMEWFYHCFWYIAIHLLKDEDKADDVLQDTFFEFDGLVRSGRVEWKGAEKFEKYARQLLLWRIADKKRGGLSKSLMSLFEPVDDEDEDSTLMDFLPSAELPPEKTAEQRESTTIIIKGVLLPLHDALKATQNALAEVVEVMTEYVTHSLCETLPPNSSQPQTLDELLESFDAKTAQFNKSDCYESIMSRLDISRNVLDQRLKRLRPVMRDWLKAVFAGKM